APVMLRAIEDLVQKYRVPDIVVSVRSTFELKVWDRALTLELEPFDDERLFQSVGRWYGAQPTTSRNLVQWLQANPKMKEVARTPLVAALLCSLFTIPIQMPSTEVELYERRYDLLLGTWDQAKGIPTLSVELRKRYRRFLRDLAIFLHLNE